MAAVVAPSLAAAKMGPKRSTGPRPTGNSPLAAGGKGSSKSRKAETPIDVDDDKGKGGKRGRPRVEQQDQSAAERRRTQIRLAQRAYRERKETTIADLEKKVALLQGHLQQMRNVIGDFQHLAIDSGIESWNPAVAQSLTDAISNVSTLAEQNKPTSDAAQPATEQPSKRVKTGRKRSHSPEPEAQPMQTGLAIHQQEWLPSLPVPDYQGPPLGYEFNLDDLEQVTNATVTLPSATEDCSSWLSGVDEFSYPPATEHVTFTQSWNTPMNKELAPIRSYHYAEVSFARRWNRFCYEDTYNMLTNPGTPPERIHKALRYSLCFGSVRMIAQRIKYKLMRPVNEPLEVWELPVLHVGGSGTHFPREGIDNSTPPPQGFAAAHNMGPWPRRITRAPAEVYPYQVAEWLGIEGVWFDAYDVEQYLRTKGLHLDGMSAIAKLEVDDAGQPVNGNPGLTSPSDGTTLSYSTPRSATSPVEATNDVFTTTTPSLDQVLHDLTPAADFSLDAAMDLDFPIFSDLPDKSDLNMFPPLEGGIIEPAIGTEVAAPKKREVAIDVEKLIRALHTDAVCLGRSPGIKQESVDKALQRVIRESFEIF